MKKNIYITDLDATLLSKDAKLSDYAKKNIKRIINSNVLFTVATARSVKSVQTIFKDIDIKLPIIEFNGAFISDLKTGNHLIINSIEKDLYKSILLELLDKNLNCFISTYNGTEDKLYYDKITNDGVKWYVNSRTINKDPRLEKVKDISKINDPDIICITVIDKNENLEAEFIRLKEIRNIEVHLQENFYSPGWYWLTIHSHKATKDQAIQELIKMNGIEDHCITVFGDNANDIKMLKYANKAIAVENAIDEVKAIADEIIESNNKDGVIKYILGQERHI